MKINIGLSDQDRKGVIDIFDVLLADEYILYTMTRNYHWNVIGPQSHDLHKFFEAQYEELNDVVDDDAERARSFYAFTPLDGVRIPFAGVVALAA